MKTLIIGGGVVGYNIAARLVDEGHDVTILDPDQTALDRITSHLDVRGLSGFGSQPRALIDADVVNTQMVVAVTNSDEVNVLARQRAVQMRAV